jgi:hypothetical protein
MTGTALGFVITCGWVGLAVSSWIIGAIAGPDPRRLKKALLLFRSHGGVEPRNPFNNPMNDFPKSGRLSVWRQFDHQHLATIRPPTLATIRSPTFGREFDHQRFVSGHEFTRAVSRTRGSGPLQAAEKPLVLKGHGFNRAEKGNRMNAGFSRCGKFFGRPALFPQPV